jgi:hypothetical protein
VITAADSPADEPRNWPRAGTKSPLDSPCRYSSGSTSVIFGVFRAHGGKNRRTEPLPFAGGRVGALVVDPRGSDLDRTSAGQHLPALVIAIAHHQAPAVLAPLGSELGYIGIHLGLQRLGQHPPRALPHDLINQRPRAILTALMAAALARDYGEHRVVPSRPARQRRSLLETSTRTPGRYTPPQPIHRFQALLRSRSSWALKVWLIDSMVWHKGLNRYALTLAPSGSA